MTTTEDALKLAAVLDGPNTDWDTTQAAHMIRELVTEREDLQAALRIASRRHIDALRDSQAWAGSDAVWSERAQKAEVKLAQAQPDLLTLLDEVADMFDNANLIKDANRTALGVTE